MLYPVHTERITLAIEGKFLKNWKAVTVYCIFTLTILLWLTGKWHGMNSYVVAMVPVVVFSVTGIVTAQDLKTLSWDVLWLVAGGIALGMALEQSGLSIHLINSIPFDLFSGGVIVIMASLVAIFMSSFISNTATANLLLPVMAAMGSNVSALQAVGGGRVIIVAVAFACSLAMALPISTPPNAIAHASGMVESRQMVKPGLIIGGVRVDIGVFNAFCTSHGSHPMKKSGLDTHLKELIRIYFSDPAKSIVLSKGDVLMKENQFNNRPLSCAERLPEGLCGQALKGIGLNCFMRHAACSWGLQLFFTNISKFINRCCRKGNRGRLYRR